MIINYKQKRLLTLLFIIGISAICRGQITLDSCRVWAKDNYPAIQRYELIQKSSEYTIDNVAREWMPKVTLSAQGSYQTDAANMGDVWNIMGLTSMLEAMNKDMPDMYMRKLQGKVQIDIQQIIWDGGQSLSEKRLAIADMQSQKARLDVDFHQLDNRVLAVYFGTLLLDEQLRGLDYTDSLLKANYSRAKTLYENNMVLRSDVEAVEVEMLSLEQKRLQLLYQSNAYRKMLSLLIGKTITTEKLLLPAEIVINLKAQKAPQWRLFDTQKEYIEMQKKSILSFSMPHISAFAQWWYGYPTLNMFEAMQSSKWGLSGIVGLRLQWNIDAYYTQKNKLKQLDIAKHEIDIQEDVFRYNQEINTIEENNNIIRLRETLENDNKIINLRKNIRQAAEIKYENGIITISELLQRISEESVAKSAKVLHKIEYIKVQYELQNQL